MLTNGSDLVPLGIHRAIESYQKLKDHRVFGQTARLGRVKRFFELYFALPQYREALEASSENFRAICTDYGLAEFDPDVIRPFWREGIVYTCQSLDLEGYPAASEWGALMTAKLNHRRLLKQLALSEVSNNALSSWRSQICSANEFSLPTAFVESNTYPVFSIELSDGCSVRCPFCGVGAHGIEKRWDTTQTNLNEYTAILSSLRIMLGPSSGIFGFLYWATDPLDHPEYEIYAELYHQIFGCVPQVTTALADRDLERTARLLETRHDRQYAPHRFSVLTSSALRKIFQRFDPEELLDVELVVQTKESLLKKATSGKRFERARKIGQEPDADDPRTIACVAGFLINLPRREIKLISPCPASDEHPLGYVTHWSALYADASAFRDRLEECVASMCRSSLDGTDRVRLSPDIEIRMSGDQPTLEGKYKELLIDAVPAGRAIIEQLGGGADLDVSSLIVMASEKGGHPLRVIEGLKRLHESGLMSINQ